MQDYVETDYFNEVKLFSLTRWHTILALSNDKQEGDILHNVDEFYEGVNSFIFRMGDCQTPIGKTSKHW